MKIEMTTQKSELLEVDVLAVGFFEEELCLGTSMQEIDEKMESQLTAILEEKSFKGKEKESVILHTFHKIPARKLMLIGLGKKAEFSPSALMKGAAEVCRQGKKAKCTRIGFLPFQQDAPEMPMSAETAGRFIHEGVITGLYEFNQYKTKEEEDLSISHVKIIMPLGCEDSEFTKGLNIGKSIGEGIVLARDLVNEPANRMTPENLALEAEALATRKGLSVEVMDQEEIEKLEMGCFLGVAQGSIHKPKLVVLRYDGDGKKAEQVIGLIGKGLTFDTGGISLKPASGMEEMKTDMAGAAAVIGAMSAIADLKPSASVIGILGICENMPSHRAYRPGDVLTAMNGKTVEVTNTDAEGRLVLADCLSFAGRLGATHLIDIATLTGACVIALGDHYTASISNNHQWQQAVLDAGKEAGEKLWPLPLDAIYKEQLKSDIADLVNAGGRQAGAITAGMFLEAFVEERPWVHLDIAGTARTSKPAPHQQKGGTGSAVSTLVQTVCNFSSSFLEDEASK